MNELMQMKSQLSSMMSSLRQKDEIINQQNQKLNQFGFGGNSMNTMNTNMNAYQNTGFLSGPNPNMMNNNPMQGINPNFMAMQNNQQHP